MVRIGILGDIGSGKSFVAQNFGYPVFNADQEVAKLYQKDKKVFIKLKKKLPKYIYSFPIPKKEISNAILSNNNNLAKIVSSWKKVPESMEAWKALPGVGPYIAAAVTSIAFQKAEAVCDGNLVRVLTRIFSITEKFKDGATAQKKLQTTAQSLMDQDHPGDFNQAMMELGAIQCFRQSPICLTCPVLSFCISGQAGAAEQFPKLEKKKKKKKSIHRYWIESEKGLLLFSNPRSKKRLFGIYELPECMPSCMESKKGAEKILLTKKRTIGNVDYLEKIIEISNYAENEIELECGYRWASRKEINKLTLSGPHRKWIQEILD